jgi:hypothetical protein
MTERDAFGVRAADQHVRRPRAVGMVGYHNHDDLTDHTAGMGDLRRTAKQPRVLVVDRAGELGVGALAQDDDGVGAPRWPRATR